MLDYIRFNQPRSKHRRNLQLAAALQCVSSSFYFHLVYLTEPQVILVPMATFPIVLGSLSGAIVALNRISTFLLAEELPEPYPIDVNSKYAVDVDADFTWEITEGVEEKFSQPKEGSEANEEKPNSIQHDKQKNENDRVLDVVVSDADEKGNKDEDKTPYSLNGLKMQIERGQFVAIVGRVGSGKVRQYRVVFARIV